MICSPQKSSRARKTSKRTLSGTLRPPSPDLYSTAMSRTSIHIDGVSCTDSRAARHTEARLWRSVIAWSSNGTRRSRGRHSPTRSVSTVRILSVYLVSPLMDLIDLSLEFLMGRALDNAMLNVGMKDIARGESCVLNTSAALTRYSRRPV